MLLASFGEEEKKIEAAHFWLSYRGYNIFEQNISEIPVREDRPSHSKYFLISNLLLKCFLSNYFDFWMVSLLKQKK